MVYSTMWKQRTWKTALLLSIVLPLSLLVAFEVSSNRAVTVEVEELTPVSWEFVRPTTNDTVTIDQSLNVTFAGEHCSIQFTVVIGVYSEHFGCYAVSVCPKTEASNENDTAVKEIEISFQNDTQLSFVNWLPQIFDYENLTLIQYADGSTAHIRFAGTNLANTVSLSTPATWYLLSPKNQTHVREIDFTVVYSEGLTQRKITQPLLLKLLGAPET